MGTDTQPNDDDVVDETTPMMSSTTSDDRRLSHEAISIDDDGTTTSRFQRVRNFCFRNWIVILVVCVLVALFAVAGERASRYAKQQNAANADDDTSDVVVVKKSIDDGKEEELVSESPYRPCQIYHSDTKLRVIQTSLGEPSRHWSPIPCYHTKIATTYPGGNEWRYVLTHKSSSQTSSSSQPPPIREYAVPDAEIKVQYEEGPAHPKREPIMGFGGAFTEASALNYMSLSEKGREAVMELLFGKNGLGYSLGRVHMNSCDFCIGSYSFDTTEDDFELNNFDTEVTHDVQCGMIDMMLNATRVVKESWPSSSSSSESGGGMRIIASPWSPPPWMKKPTKEDSESAIHAENMTDSATPTCLREGTDESSRYAKAWALYFSKFINAYKDLGINLYGVTPQNEPEFPAPWEACSYDPYEEGNFIAHHLGPLLNATHPNIKLLMFDHNKDHAPRWARYLLDPSHPASQYIDGTAVHWYAGGMDRLLDGAVGTPNMHRLVHDLHKRGLHKHIVLGSEACHCPSTGYAGGDLYVAWARAERYAHTVLADLVTGSNGWIEWNLILDSIGGPNHLGNNCDSTLLAVPHRAKDAATNNIETLEFEDNLPFGPPVGDQRTREELNALGFSAEYIDVGVVVQPMYYYMGHISRYVRPGSKAIKALVDSSAASSGKGEEKKTTSTHQRAFRPKGQVVAGGGINDLARTGVELTTWPCEGSTRQQFKFNDVGQIQVFGHDWLGRPTTSCIGKERDVDFEGLVLTPCDKDHAGVFEIRPFVNGNYDDDDGENTGGVNIVLTNGVVDGGGTLSCLSIEPLKNGGGAYGPRGGAQVDTGHCKSLRAEWILDKETGEVLSNFFVKEKVERGGTGGVDDEVCLTTGWPFLQVGAFETPTTTTTSDAEDDDGEEEENKVVVVLNEAGEAANFVLRDGTKLIMTSSIPPHSIQTILFN